MKTGRFPVRVAVALLATLPLAASLASTSASSESSRPRATSAECGGVETVGTTAWHHRSLPPLAVGDSTMLLSLPALSRDGFSGNAHGCRQYPEALELLSGLAHAHQLPHLVVIALGANGAIEDTNIKQALQILGPHRLLVLLTPRQLGGSSGSNAELVRAEARRHPGRVVVLDWVAYSAGHPGWFQPDGLHLTLSGAAAFASLIASVRPLASEPRSLPEPPCLGTVPPSSVILSGITARLPPGTFALDPRSPVAHLMLTNSNPFPVVGVAGLRLLEAPRATIAASCVVLPPGGSADVALRVEAQADEGVQLLGHYRVQLQLRLLGQAGQTLTLATPHVLLSRAPRSRSRFVIAG
jgi:hypothetical protein